MKIRLLVVFITFMSCTTATQYGMPDTDPNLIQKDFMKWYTYHYNTIILSSDFKAIDENSKIIDKENFLKKLILGKYIPIQLVSKNGQQFYQLFKLEPNCNPNIQSTIKNESLQSYRNFKKEGTSIPHFNFKDLKGVKYNNETTKNKIIVLKCWNLHCQKCIEEMPELNSLVEKYKTRTDIVFISLADDNSQKLSNFLTKKKFNYAVVPNQALFIKNTLRVSVYPTHIIINKKGKISKEVTSFKELAIALQKEALK
nr:TlpA disulfide reductase family protein [uncultured Flavobacterium sp.]